MYSKLLHAPMFPDYLPQVFGRRDQLGLRKAKKGSTKKGSGKGKQSMKRKKSFGSGKGLRKLRKMKGSASSLVSEAPEDEAMETPKAKSKKQHAKCKAADKSKAAAKPKAAPKAKSKAKAAPATTKGKAASSTKKSSPSKEAQGKANKSKGKRAAAPTPAPSKKPGKRKAAQEQSFAGAADDLEYIVYFANTFNFEDTEDMREAVKEWLPNYESCGFDVYYTQKRYGCGVYLKPVAMEKIKKASLCYFSFGQTDQGFAVATGAAICLEARTDYTDCVSSKPYMSILESMSDCCHSHAYCQG